MGGSRLIIQNQKNIIITSLTAITALLFGLPILLGLIGIVLPASGYFPALDKTSVSGDAALAFLSTPGLLLAGALCACWRAHRPRQRGEGLRTRQVARAMPFFSLESGS